MSRKYLCDNCGAEFDCLEYYDEETETNRDNLWTFGATLTSNISREPPYYGKIGEYCRDCSNKLQKLIKEGF